MTGAAQRYNVSRRKHGFLGGIEICVAAPHLFHEESFSRITGFEIAHSPAGGTQSLYAISAQREACIGGKEPGPRMVDVQLGFEFLGLGAKIDPQQFRSEQTEEPDGAGRAE